MLAWNSRKSPLKGLSEEGGLAYCQIPRDRPCLGLLRACTLFLSKCNPKGFFAFPFFSALDGGRQLAPTSLEGFLKHSKAMTKVVLQVPTTPINICICTCGFPDSSVGKESSCKAGDPGLIPASGRFPWRRHRLPTPVFLVFPCGSAGKEFACNCGRPRFNPWVGKISWRRERPPIQVFWPGEFHGLYSP